MSEAAMAAQRRAVGKRSFTGTLCSGPDPAARRFLRCGVFGCSTFTRLDIAIGKGAIFLFEIGRIALIRCCFSSIFVGGPRYGPVPRFRLLCL
ncbi:MAG: hypothetical protein QHC90_08275 [Shinella sp.]|nr:hypothetical protein [Shinella sp.]